MEYCGAYQKKGVTSLEDHRFLTLLTADYKVFARRIANDSDHGCLTYQRQASTAAGTEIRGSAGSKGVRGLRRDHKYPAMHIIDRL
jgi:hypothetical protein